MKETEGGLFSCRNTCWIVGALLGLVTFLLIIGAGFLWALIVGVVLAVAIALVLQRMFCAGAGAAAGHHLIAGDVALTTGAGASAALDHADDDHSRAAAEAAASAMTGDEEVAAAISGDAARTTPAAMLDAAAVKADVPARTHSKAKAEPSKAKVKAKSAAPKGAAAKSSKATTTARSKAAPVAKDGKPELFDAPQGAADDLKLIKGVGPKLEQTLNALGIWHHSQIAGWRKKEVEWVDGQLKFKGRIERDDWIKQAKALAKGEATEFSKRAAKSGMYDK